MITGMINCNQLKFDQYNLNTHSTRVQLNHPWPNPNLTWALENGNGLGYH